MKAEPKRRGEFAPGRDLKVYRVAHVPGRSRILAEWSEGRPDKYGGH